MGFFTGNWPEIVSALIAAAALVVALRVGHENRKFKAPDFRITFAGNNVDGQSVITITNKGESAAKDVKITFGMDPTGIFTTASREWMVIDRDESVQITFDTSSPYPNIAYQSWLGFVLLDHPERRAATVEYRTRLGKRVSEEVLLPSAEDIAEGPVPSLTQESDSL